MYAILLYCVIKSTKWEKEREKIFRKLKIQMKDGTKWMKKTTNMIGLDTRKRNFLALNCVCVCVCSCRMEVLLFRTNRFLCVLASCTACRAPLLFPIVMSYCCWNAFFRRLLLLIFHFQFFFHSHFHSNVHINCKDSVWLLRLSTLHTHAHKRVAVSQRFFLIYCCCCCCCCCSRFTSLWLLNNFFFFWLDDFSSCAIVCIHFSHCYQPQRARYLTFLTVGLQHRSCIFLLFMILIFRPP